MIAVHCMYKLCLSMLHIPTIKLTDIQLNERLVVQVKWFPD